MMFQRTGVKGTEPSVKASPYHKNARMHWAVTHPRWTRWRSGERPRLPPKGPGLNLVRTYCFFHWPQVLPLQLPPSATTPTGDKPRINKFSLNLCQFSVCPPWTCQMIHPASYGWSMRQVFCSIPQPER